MNSDSQIVVSGKQLSDSAAQNLLLELEDEACSWILFICLSRNRLTRSPSLNRMVQLTKLDLQHNDIKQIDLNLFDLPLRYLWLSYNEISRVPREISKLTSLVDLGLGMNNIRTFPNLSKLTLLQRLNLFQNDVGHIPSTELRRLTNLRSLNLIDNRRLPKELAKQVLEVQSVKTILGNAEAYFRREDKIVRICLWLIWARKKGKEECGLFGELDKNVVVKIAKYVFYSRKDRCWDSCLF